MAGVLGSSWSMIACNSCSLSCGFFFVPDTTLVFIHDWGLKTIFFTHYIMLVVDCLVLVRVRSPLFQLEFDLDLSVSSPICVSLTIFSTSSLFISIKCYSCRSTNWSLLSPPWPFPSPSSQHPKPPFVRCPCRPTFHPPPYLSHRPSIHG